MFGLAHNHEPVAHIGYDGQIVADDDEGQPKLFTQAVQKI